VLNLITPSKFLQGVSQTLQITHAFLLVTQVLLVILNPVVLHKLVNPLVNVKPFLADLGQLSKSVVEIGRIVVHVQTEFKLALAFDHQLQSFLFLVHVLI
jgi:hypothetical protein